MFPDFWKVRLVARIAAINLYSKELLSLEAPPSLSGIWQIVDRVMGHRGLLPVDHTIRCVTFSLTIKVTKRG